MFIKLTCVRGVGRIVRRINMDLVGDYTDDDSGALLAYPDDAQTIVTEAPDEIDALLADARTGHACIVAREFAMAMRIGS